MSEKKFAEIIRSAREKKEFTQAQVAEGTHVTSAYISELENNRKTPPPYRTVALLAKTLELDADGLWNVAQVEREAYKRRSDERKRAGIQELAVGQIQQLSGAQLNHFEKEVLNKVRFIKEGDRSYFLRFLNGLISNTDSEV
jgi:transcriptional regulator with XRE-family HTH domain